MRHRRRIAVALSMDGFSGPLATEGAILHLAYVFRHSRKFAYSLLSPTRSTFHMRLSVFCPLSHEEMVVY